MEEADKLPLENKGISKAVDMYQENLEGSLWWMQDNEYIYRGYRSQLSFWDAVKRLVSGWKLIRSMGRSTNETMNVWTHVVGAIIFIYLLFLTYSLPAEPIGTTSLHFSSFLEALTEEVANFRAGSPTVPRLANHNPLCCVRFAALLEVLYFITSSV